MNALLAWRTLTHEKGRSALAAAGIFIAVLMVFLELGFYASVPRAGMLVYDHMRFDLVLTSSDYVSQEEAFEFPRQRLYDAFALPEVEAIAPVYEGEASWLNPLGHVRRDVFVLGIRLGDHDFVVPEIDRQTEALRRPDTVLLDAQSLPVYGVRSPGTRVEIAGRAMTVEGTYRLGTGFLGLGVVATSDLNFLRLFPGRSLAAPTLGLVRLKQGAVPDAAARALRRMLPADTQVFTRAELAQHEVGYWATRTATGIVFGFGVVVSVAVGILILNQTISAQIVRQLPQYATMKAIGYADAHLGRSVVAMSALLTGAAFVPAAGVAVLIYRLVRAAARLPIEMTLERIIGVLVVALVMASASVFLALRVVRRADPAELF